MISSSVIIIITISIFESTIFFLLISVRAKTYIPTGNDIHDVVLCNVAQESHYPCGLLKSTWLKSVTLSVNYSAPSKGCTPCTACGMDFFEFCNNSYVNILRDIHSIPRLCILVIIITDCEIVYLLVLRCPVLISASCT